MGMQILVIGLAGSGKSTVGRALAQKLGIAYVDGDRLHPQANLDKMAKGTPLSDENRDEWVENIINALEHGNVVIGASLLKAHYRELINRRIQRVKFAQLDAPASVLEARLSDPTGNLFRKPLLNAQLRIADPLGPQEPGKRYDATLPVDVLVARIATDFRVE